MGDLATDAAAASETGKFRVGTIVVEVHFESNGITANEKPVEQLTKKTVALALKLARHPDEVQSRATLLAALYADEDHRSWPEEKIIDVFVEKLQRALSATEPGAGDVIQKVWGKGYMIGSGTAAPASA